MNRSVDLKPSRRQGIGSVHVGRHRLGAILARAGVLAEHQARAEKGDRYQR